MLETIEKLKEELENIEFYEDYTDAATRVDTYDNPVCMIYDKLCASINVYYYGKTDCNLSYIHLFKDMIEYLQKIRDIGQALFSYEEDKYKPTDVWNDKKELEELKNEWEFYRNEVLDLCERFINKDKPKLI